MKPKVHIKSKSKMLVVWVDKHDKVQFFGNLSKKQKTLVADALTDLAHDIVRPHKVN